jgi:hypothetical protein
MIPGRIAHGRRRRTNITAPPVTGIDVEVASFGAALLPEFSTTSAMFTAEPSAFPSVVAVTSTAKQKE